MLGALDGYEEGCAWGDVLAVLFFPGEEVVEIYGEVWMDGDGSGLGALGDGVGDF